MPAPADFRRAFKLELGSHLGPENEWLIESCRVGHVVKQQNERYEFPTELTLAWQGRGGTATKQAAQRAFQAAAKQRPIVFSAYGSPYECSYGSPAVAAVEEAEEGEQEGPGGNGGRETSGPRFRIACLGKAVRRRDLPTLKQKAAEEREARGEAEVTPEDERRYLSAFRVIKSRFGTSKCSLCGEAIEPGVKICKRQGEGGRGGWAHASCQVARQRGDVAGEEEEEEEEEGEGRAGGAGSRKRKRAQPGGGKQRGGVPKTGKGGKGSKGGKSGKSSGKGVKPARQAKAGGGVKRKRQAAELEE